MSRLRDSLIMGLFIIICLIAAISAILYYPLTRWMTREPKPIK